MHIRFQSDANGKKHGRHPGNTERFGMSIYQILSGGRFDQALKYRKGKDRRGDGAGGGSGQWTVLGRVTGEFQHDYFLKLADGAASTHKGGR